VDASSIIDIMTLACMNGTEITLQVGDASDIDILKKIIGLFETGFGE
jgi:phosphocarrier protein